MVNGMLKYLFLSRAIVSNAAATQIAPSQVHALVPNAAAKPMATLYPLHAVVFNAMVRPTATPSEDDGKLDGSNGSGDAFAI